MRKSIVVWFPVVAMMAVLGFAKMERQRKQATQRELFVKSAIDRHGYDTQTWDRYGKHLERLPYRERGKWLNHAWQYRDDRSK